MREGRKLRKEHDGNLNASEHRPEENYTKRLRVEHLSLGLCIMFATSLESKLKLVCHDVRCPPRNGAFCHWALVFCVGRWGRWAICFGANVRVLLRHSRRGIVRDLLLGDSIFEDPISSLRAPRVDAFGRGLSILSGVSQIEAWFDRIHHNRTY